MNRIRIYGQRRVVALLREIDANVLFIGPPGYGKTTLARLYLARWGQPLELNCTRSDIAHVLHTTPYKRPVLLDEAHCLTQPEAVYPYLDAGRHVALTTTDDGLLPGPLRSRLVPIELEPYTMDELAAIARDAGAVPGADLLVASLSRGSPRRAHLLGQMIRTARTVTHANTLLELAGYENGLSPRERRYLDFLRTGPKSLNTIASHLQTSPQTVREIESGLITMGLVQITSKGRTLVNHES